MRGLNRDKTEVKAYGNMVKIDQFGTPTCINFGAR